MHLRISPNASPGKFTRHAFKFTQEERIEVGVRDLNGKERLEWTVADTGIGRKKEVPDRISEIYDQPEEAQTRHHQGVGLGLSIVKRYLDLMKGDIRVESEPGKGSTFTFTLPRSI